MKYFAILLAFLIVGCSPAAEVKVPTYEELVAYPSRCDAKKEQLAYLKKVQTIKGFASDPDLLNEADREYNSRLKALIWWYSWKCDQS